MSDLQVTPRFLQRCFHRLEEERDLSVSRGPVTRRHNDEI